MQMFHVSCLLRELHLATKTRWRGIGSSKGKTKSQEREPVDKEDADEHVDDVGEDEGACWSWSPDAEDG